MQLQEPKARESLLTPTMRHQSSKSSLATTETAATTISSPDSSTPASSLNIPEKPLPGPPSASEISPLQHVTIATAALMERPTFAIDNVRDEEEEEEAFGIGGDDDDQVMDEVINFWLAHCDDLDKKN